MGGFILAVTVVSGGCGPTIQTGLEDARITMRVRTALVNDPLLGPEEIEVEVRGGAVELSGRVTTPDLIERAEDVVRRVSGVRQVTTTLEVAPRSDVDREKLGRLPSIPGPETDGPLRILGLGVGAAGAVFGDSAMGNSLGAGPIVRLRPRNGWGPSLGFSWTRSPILVSPTGEAALATLAVRPVMGGVEYGVTRGRLASAVSLVGGYAFNSLSVDTTQAGPNRAIAVDNALALRVGVSLWVDVSPRVGLNLFGGYRYTRPRVTFAGDSVLETHRLNADAALIGVGVAYWVF